MPDKFMFRKSLNEYTEEMFLQSYLRINEIKEINIKAKAQVIELLFHCIGKSVKFTRTILYLELSKHFEFKLMLDALVQRIINNDMNKG